MLWIKSIDEKVTTFKPRIKKIEAETIFVWKCEELRLSCRNQTLNLHSNKTIFFWCEYSFQNAFIKKVLIHYHVKVSTPNKIAQKLSTCDELRWVHDETVHCAKFFAQYAILQII